MALYGSPVPLFSGMDGGVLPLQTPGTHPPGGTHARTHLWGVPKGAPAPILPWVYLEEITTRGGCACSLVRCTAFVDVGVDGRTGHELALCLEVEVGEEGGSGSGG